MKTVAVIEGWAGGPKLTRLLRRALTKSGFTIIKDAGRADIIFAHSTGCYMLPGNIQAQLILLIDPPYWPDQSIVGRWVRMNKAELKFLRKQQGTRQFLKDKLWEIYYIFAKPRFSWSIAKNRSHLDFLDRLSDKPIILIRNKDDEFCSPEVKAALKSYMNVKYVEIPGYHANYYLEPQPYVDLLLKNI